MYRRYIKPFFDFSFALLGIIMVSPVIGIAVLFLFLSAQGKVFFLQKRPGVGGKIFTIIKLKTMNDKKDNAGKLLPDKERLTPIGKWIRKSSIDELPQLINVLKGEMSIVGPRPLLPEYLNLYSDFQNRRHEVKPGITGWAQINGRNAIDWDIKFNYDVWYVDNISFILDCKIILKTIVNVIYSKNINPINNISIEPFHGKY